MSIVFRCDVPKDIPKEKWWKFKLTPAKVVNPMAGVYIGEVVELIEEGFKNRLLRAWVYGLWEKDASPWAPNIWQEQQKDGSWKFPEYLLEAKEDVDIRVPLVGCFTAIRFENGDINKPVWDGELPIVSVERVEDKDRND